MKSFLLFIILVALYKTEAKNVNHSKSFDSEWDDFKKTFSKNYELVEESVRRLIFENNMNKINAHNSKKSKTFEMSANEYSDLTDEEFNRIFNRLQLPKNLNRTKNYVKKNSVKAADLPDSKDWNKEGYVSPVKSQGKCGACWAFATTGAIESHVKISNKKEVSLSEQNLIDCSTSYGNKGCQGGWPDYAFQYIIDNKGIDSESSYEYKERNGKCAFDRSNVAATISSFIDIESGNEDALTGIEIIISMFLNEF